MSQYLARNLKADVDWRRHATQSWTLSLKYLSVKPRLLMKQGWFLEIKSQLEKSFKVSR